MIDRFRPGDVVRWPDDNAVTLVGHVNGAHGPTGGTGDPVVDRMSEEHCHCAGDACALTGGVARA